MTPEETCKMIDTIREGKEYEYKVTQRDGIWFGGNDESVHFSPDYDNNIEIDNPRQAREIAAALVAWADHKDGIDDGYNAAKFLFEIARVRAAQKKHDEFIVAVDPANEKGIAFFPKSHPEV